MVFGVGGSNGAICGSIKSKMASDGHLGMTALSRVILASAGLSCLTVFHSDAFEVNRGVMTGGMFNNRFITNFQEIWIVKEFRKSDSI